MIISPHMQAIAEHPSHLTYEQKGAFERYVLEYQGTVVRLADEGRYGEIPTLAEDPELISARQQLVNDERASTLRIERRRQIIDNEFFGPSLVTRGRVYLAAMVGCVLAILSVIPLGLW